MNSQFLSAARALTAGVVVGLALLGAVVCLAALRLSVGGGLLLVAASTAAGLLVLAGRAVVQRYQVRASAAGGVRDAEAWLERSRRRAEGGG